MGRFINADAALSTGTGIIGCNSFAYCNNSPTTHIDATGTKPSSIEELEGYRFVGMGVQLDASVGCYECGVEIIVYWDKDVCSDGEPIVVVYTYEGASVNLDELLTNPYISNMVTQLTAAVLTNSQTELSTKATLVTLQGLVFNDFGLSASVVAIFGNDMFIESADYEGRFDTYSVNIKHIKVSYSWSPSCFTIALGVTTNASFHVSFGSTNYTMLY